MKRRLVIVGTGGHGRVVADCALRSGAYETVVFADDNPAAAAPPGFALIGGRQEALARGDDHDVFVAIGRADVRARPHAARKGAPV